MDLLEETIEVETEVVVITTEDVKLLFKRKSLLMKKYKDKYVKL